VYEVVYSFAVHMLLAVFVVFCLRGGGGEFLYSTVIVIYPITYLSSQMP
jgi:hypothetical protein